MKAKYALEGATQVVVDLEKIEELGVTPVLGDYLGEGEVARHDTAAIANDLLTLVCQRESGRKIAVQRSAPVHS
jgi:hypothetical protein